MMVKSLRNRLFCLRTIPSQTNFVLSLPVSLVGKSHCIIYDSQTSNLCLSQVEVVLSYILFHHNSYESFENQFATVT